MAPWDTVRLGMIGLRTRPLRTVLAALGIAIGIAALIAVVGVPASNQAALRNELAGLGPNLLTVAPGADPLTGKKAVLPAESVTMIKRIGPVQSVSAIGMTTASVRRTDRVPSTEGGGLRVVAGNLDLLGVLNARVRTGGFLDAATERFPVTVLGARAAQLLAVGPGVLVWIKDRWFTVAGVLEPVPLAPEVDNSVMVGWPAAQTYLGFDGRPGQIYVRADERAVDDVKSVLGRTTNPARPNEVLVSRPSDALAAQRLVDQAYSSLFIGLGAVALLVGGIGVANTMVISVLERRREIGLRRALGASRRQIGGQFLTESIALAGLGGGLGVLLGTAVTAGYSAYQGWPTVLPAGMLAGGVGAAVLIGVIAGVYPAARAARLTPTEALATT
ncbi:putative ABC transport system permease protein [Kibdelosporangium banguiense]|uniref:ABC transport system permease protein n=1 Tax=Kibdelosporangium banguiense TaxID=1365924 RepID=A0ABS4T8K0_9PSEU|nr:ABC transporter permease [Kibdelosporangium banguiense]MBP2320744.1 putative ABC transport system permease protein [Kibdelosporangium banguiense]